MLELDNGFVQIIGYVISVKFLFWIPMPKWNYTVTYLKVLPQMYDWILTFLELISLSRVLFTSSVPSLLVEPLSLWFLVLLVLWFSSHSVSDFYRMPLVHSNFINYRRRLTVNMKRWSSMIVRLSSGQMNVYYLNPLRLMARLSAGMAKRVPPHPSLCRFWSS